MNFSIKYMGKLMGPTTEFQRSMVFETGEFERPKMDCIHFSQNSEIKGQNLHIVDGSCLNFFLTLIR